MKPRTLEIIRDEHASMAAMLQSMRMMVTKGPGDDRVRFFEVLRAMLLYIHEFPECQHHPKETELLFPRVLKAVPELDVVVVRLDRDHEYTELTVRKLHQLLVAWEMLGDERKQAFEELLTRYTNLYLAHIQLEEQEIMTAAHKHLTEADWKVLDAAFEGNRDPLSGKHKADPAFERLFDHILHNAPAPIGLGG